MRFGISAYLFLTLLSVTQASACKDTLYMHPCFRLIYDDRIWKGPSSDDIPLKQDATGKRFMNNHYLYPGSAENVTIKNRRFGSVSFETGYSIEHPLRLFLYGIADETGFREDRPVLHNETVHINGYNFTIQTVDLGFEKPEITLVGLLDTVFSNQATLHIDAWADSSKRGRRKLLKTLTALSDITFIEPSELDSLHEVRLDSLAYMRTLNMSYEQYVANFVINEKKMLSCMDVAGIRSLMMNQMSDDRITEMMSRSAYGEIADSIFKFHRDYIQKTGTAFYNYTKQSYPMCGREWSWYRSIAFGTADLNAYLNYMSDHPTETFIDTLDRFRVVRSITAYDIIRDMQRDSWDDIPMHLSARKQSFVEPEFARQAAIQLLNFEPDEQVHYRKVSDGKNRKIYLISRLPNLTDSDLLVCSRRSQGWKMDSYRVTLPAQGETVRLASFNHTFVVPGIESTLILETDRDSLQVNKLASYEHDLKKFDAVMQVTRPYSESGDNLGIELFYLSDKYNLGDLPPSRIVYHQPFVVADLNGDRVSEMFRYDMSNGMLVNSECYTHQDNKLVTVSADDFAAWIHRDSQFRFLKLYSCIGNHSR